MKESQSVSHMGARMYSNGERKREVSAMGLFRGDHSLAVRRRLSRSESATKDGTEKREERDEARTRTSCVQSLRSSAWDKKSWGGAIKRDG